MSDAINPETGLKDSDLMVDPRDLSIICHIVQRATRSPANVDGTPAVTDPQQLIMDLALCHKWRCPLLLEAMLTTTDQFAFDHDVFGIQRNWDRHTFQLRNGFAPKFKRMTA